MHESVLLHETIEGLDIQNKEVVVDGTLGRGGHSIEAMKVAKIRGGNIFIIGIDRDQDAIEESEKKLQMAAKDTGSNFKLFKGNFRDLDKFLSLSQGETGKDRADKIMLDLGLSSPHIDSSGRGFSFMKDEPLMMTMEKKPDESAFTAKDIVNGWAEEDIANVIYAYGEERYSRRIAKAIVEAREEGSIETTSRLREIVENAVPGIYKRGKIHPATKTFQALRIAVNDELAHLKVGLNKAISCLSEGGRIAVISFHSLEDRIVKNAFREWARQGLGKQMTKKPIIPQEEEIKANSRARSAKLRIFIKNN